MSRKVGIEQSTYEDWPNPDVEVVPVNAIERAAWKYAVEAHGNHPADEDDRRNAMWDYIAGARRVLEEAEGMAWETSRGRRGDYTVVNLAQLRALFAESKEAP